MVVTIYIAACVETDIYLPAFSDMMCHFGVTEAQIQQLLTWNFFGFCLSGLIYGPVSDAIGRRKPLLFALSLFFVGSLLTVMWESFEMMRFGRLLQGLGSGGAFTLGMAVLFDVFQGVEAKKAVSDVNTAVPFMITLAPMIGAYLNLNYGFRSNFVAIAALVLVSLAICVLFFKETLPAERRAPLDVQQLRRDYIRAFSTPAFWQITLVVSLMFGGYVAFMSSAAIVFPLDLGVSKTVFPFFQAAVLIAWLCGSLSFSRALKTFGIPKMKVIGVGLSVIAVSCLVIFATLAPTNPYAITIPMVVYAFGANWIQSIYFPEGIEALPDIRGISASLLSSTRLLITALLVGIASYFYDDSILPVVYVIAGSMLVIFPTLLLYERGRQSLKPCQPLEK